ncbi:MAG: T9SS type A sorting domain-containing protein [Balneolaceae bacterium]
MGSIQLSNAQDYRWLSAGSFHNFYSSVGTENEQGFIGEQQAGWQWPAIYRSQDAQNWKSLWLGVTDFTDEDGNDYPVRIAHAGPRITGLGQFFPMEFETRSKFAPPVVSVDGVQSQSKTVINDVVDPSMKADREIYTRVNTLIGVEVKRTIKQFSQQHHDNYHIVEYEFTNTGNIDDDDEIELPNQTLEGFVPYITNRMAPVQATRYVFGNDTGWGRNTMVDRRGDGQQPGEMEEFRAHFAWHGYWQQEVDYDNIGGPILVPNTSRNYLTADDTTGRLGAYHFVGTVTVHADTSPTDDTDDPGQPFTMSEIHSDNDLLFPPNDAFSVSAMTDEYAVMTEGRTTRHAYRVEPDGEEGFLEPSTLPNLGNSGGFSYAYGYGPYTLAPGESVKIVIAEASAGISRELADETGVAFKNGDITAREKNEVVFQGRDSLFQTFERAIENFESDYSIPEAPDPPTEFRLSSAGTGVEMEWFHDNSSALQGYQIYRSSGRVDSTYRLLYEADASENFIIDGDEATRQDFPGDFLLDTPIRGRDYYYYIIAVGENNTDATGLTPTGSSLISNRYYSQSYDPGRLLRPAGEAMTEIRVVPNPYNPNADDNLLLDQENLDRLAFYEIPGICTIQIYTELGELVRTIEHSNMSGDENWDLKTDYRQRVVSGIYIARIINKDPNDDEFGSVATRKIVIIL